MKGIHILLMIVYCKVIINQDLEPKRNITWNNNNLTVL